MRASPYNVIKVERSQPPKGADRGSSWYRYVVANRDSRITGRRCGTREQVSQHAGGFAEELNRRAKNGHSIWNPRRGRRQAAVSPKKKTA